MAEMNADAKAWVEALLSGKYKQGTDCLRSNDNEFCCLGVAADLLTAGAWVPGELVIDDADEPAEVYGVKTDFGDVATELLPTPLWERLTAGARYRVPQDEIACANDQGATFAEIVKQYILPMWTDETEDTADAA